MRRNSEAIVVGAGYIGCSVAYYLSRAGIKTALFDRDRVGGGASRGNYGNIQLQGSELEHSLPMVTEGYRQCLEIEEELDLPVGYQRIGAILTIETEGQWERMKSRLPRLHAAGIEAELVPTERLHEIEPMLSTENLLGCLYNPNEGQICPFHLMWGYVSRAREKGLIYCPDTEVLDFIVEGGKIKAVETDQGRFESDVVILTTGAWTNRLGRKLGKDWKIEFVHGQAFVSVAIERVLHSYLATASFFQQTHAEAEAEPTDVDTAAMSIAQSQHGNLLLGEAAFPTSKIGFHTTPRALRAVAKTAAQYIPRINQVQVLRSWATPVAFTHDGLPFFGPVEDIPGLYMATAFRSTVISTPIAGKTIAQLVTRGKSDLDISAFLPDRPQ